MCSVQKLFCLFLSPSSRIVSISTIWISSSRTLFSYQCQWSVPSPACFRFYTVLVGSFCTRYTFLRVFHYIIIGVWLIAGIIQRGASSSSYISRVLPQAYFYYNKHQIPVLRNHYPHDVFLSLVLSLWNQNRGVYTLEFCAARTMRPARQIALHQRLIRPFFIQDRTYISFKRSR